MVLICKLFFEPTFTKDTYYQLFQFFYVINPKVTNTIKLKSFYIHYLQNSKYNYIFFKLMKLPNEAHALRLGRMLIIYKYRYK